MVRSNNADIRELQVDVKYIKEKMDEAIDHLKYTNGKVAQTISDINEIREARKQFVTKEDLAAFKLSAVVKESDKWEKFKWMLVGSLISIATWVITTFGSKILG